MIEIAACSQQVQSPTILRNNLLHKLIGAEDAVLDPLVIDAVKKDQQVNVSVHL